MTTQGTKHAELRLKQIHPNEATVLVWRAARGVRALHHPGHIGVLLRSGMQQGPFFAETIYGPDEASFIRYVSFWPWSDARKRTVFGEQFMKRSANFQEHHPSDYIAELGANAREGLEEGTLIPLENQIVVLVHPETGEDVWGARQDVLLHLRGLAAETPGHLGLNLGAIVDWCLRFRASPDFNYTFISRTKNCAGIAIKALAAGGGEIFAKVGNAGSAAHIYVTPNDGMRWAEAVARGIQTVNQWIEKLRNDSARISLMNGRDELPAAGAWTYSAGAGAARDIKAIAAALEKYHHPGVNSGLARMEALVALIKLVHGVLRAEPMAGDAYRQLAARICQAVARLAREGDREWDPRMFANDPGLMDPKWNKPSSDRGSRASSFASSRGTSSRASSARLSSADI